MIPPQECNQAKSTEGDGLCAYQNNHSSVRKGHTYVSFTWNKVTSCDAKLIQGFASLSLLELREVQLFKDQQIHRTANNFANKVTYGSEKAKMPGQYCELISLKNKNK